MAEAFEYPLTTDVESTILKIHKLNCKVEIVGSDENVIRLHGKSPKPLPDKAKGLKPLLVVGTDNTGLGLELLPSEDSSSLTLRQSRRRIGAKIRIEVPKNMSLNFQAHINQGVMISGHSGEITAATLNGSMDIDEVTGPLILNTTNGGIDVRISQLNQDYPSSISSVNGEIDLSISEDEKADIHLSLVHGEAYSNLELSRKSGEDGMAHLAGNFKTKSTLNGGGVRLSLSTVNGKIYIRKAETSSDSE